MFRMYTKGRPDLTFRRLIENIHWFDMSKIYEPGDQVWFVELGAANFTTAHVDQIPAEDLDADRNEMTEKYSEYLKNVYTVVEKVPSGPFEWPHESGSMIMIQMNMDGTGEWKVPPAQFKWQRARYMPSQTNKLSYWQYATHAGEDAPEDSNEIEPETTLTYAQIRGMSLEAIDSLAAVMHLPSEAPEEYEQLKSRMEVIKAGATRTTVGKATKTDFITGKFMDGTTEWWVGDGGYPTKRPQFWKNTYEI